jgi:hypothetical protein
LFFVIWITLQVPPPSKEYVLKMCDFSNESVGAKSRNTVILHDSLGGGKLPDWIKLPSSAAVPFGTMERVLDHEDNAYVKKVGGPAWFGLRFSTSMFPKCP